MYRVKQFSLFALLTIFVVGFASSVWKFQQDQVQLKWVIGSWFGMIILAATSTNSFTRSFWGIGDAIPIFGWVISLGMITLYSALAAPILAIQALWRACIGDPTANVTKPTVEVPDIQIEANTSSSVVRRGK